MPAWLLEEDLRIRSSDPAFIEAVDRYYDRLLGLLTPYQVDLGGPILMMQVENEYGSYGEDKGLSSCHSGFDEKRHDLSLFTSDGPWRATLRTGTLIEDGPLCDGKLWFQSSL